MGGHAPGGQILEVTKCERDIGVLISNDLKPSLQCASAAQKANQLLGRMSRSFSYRDKYTWIRLYKVYVRPLLEYCVQAWSPWLKSDIELLEGVQKRVLKMTSGFHSTLYLDKLKEVNMTTLEERRIREDLIQTWKILHKHDNVKEGIWFTRSVDTAQRETRFTTCNMNLNSKQCNLDIRKNFFSLRVIKRWNSLPIDIKNATSLISFKNMYDKHISSM